jgi:hypothetical protein
VRHHRQGLQGGGSVRDPATVTRDIAVLTVTVPAPQTVSIQLGLSRAVHIMIIEGQAVINEYVHAYGSAALASSAKSHFS